MIKNIVRKIPIVNNIALNIYCKIKKIPRLSNSATYWEERYKYGQNSGLGSYGKLAEFKAEVMNKFIEENDINTVIEFGCGDGNQLQYYKFKNYLGFDVSKTTVKACREKFASDKSKQFYHLSEFKDQKADLVISIDVIFHLLEDEVFDAHMTQLFASSNKYVIIYSSNVNDVSDVKTHVRQWKFTDWVESNAKNFSLIEKIDNKYPYKEGDLNTSFADFYIYKKN